MYDNQTQQYSYRPPTPIDPLRAAAVGALDMARDELFEHLWGAISDAADMLHSDDLAALWQDVDEHICDRVEQALLHRNRAIARAMFEAGQMYAARK